MLREDGRIGLISHGTFEVVGHSKRLQPWQVARSNTRALSGSAARTGNSLFVQRLPSRISVGAKSPMRSSSSGVDFAGVEFGVDFR